jgi:hypothetical protein
LELSLLGVGVATDGKQGLEVSVLLLEKIELLYVSVGVGARGFLRISGVANLIICPGIRRDSIKIVN